MKLSILICTIVGREKYLERIISILNKQKKNDVEVIIECDDCKISIGEKRNILMEKASGTYICYVDDDDYVSDNYIEKILEALETNPDTVGFTSLITINGQNPKPVYSSMKYGWVNNRTSYLRPIQHLNPVKKKLLCNVNLNILVTMKTNIMLKN